MCGESKIKFLKYISEAVCNNEHFEYVHSTLAMTVRSETLVAFVQGLFTRHWSARNLLDLIIVFSHKFTSYLCQQPRVK